MSTTQLCGLIKRARRRAGGRPGARASSPYSARSQPVLPERRVRDSPGTTSPPTPRCRGTESIGARGPRETLRGGRSRRRAVGTVGCPSREVPPNDVVGHRQESAVLTLGALDPRLLADDAANPLVRAARTPAIRAHSTGSKSTVPKTVPTRSAKTRRFPQCFGEGGSTKTVA